MIVDPNKPIAFIPIEDACPESFVQFGDLVEPPVGGGRVTIPTSLTPSLTDGGPTLTFITLSPATFEIERSAQLERHPFSVQVFIPLGDAPMVCIVASDGSPPERADSLRAFRTRPGQAVVLREGTWHFGMMCEGEAMAAATFIYRLANGEDTERLPLKAQIRLVPTSTG
ncbi:ureidoglycolate lyase (plasmid) [Sulfitobacter sp. W027]|uniref:ureidoglycolate lyase n=1 Tax=Sulfitobacter sp. W027 TaxID=2867025 RepID=UPI0021A93874|nr:ureidoglycolate lyase [Sulfitobacter sp. W027]UWR35342.1 ureidoglycolate lyase [Sulfitobacter sp. W027]